MEDRMEYGAPRNAADRLRALLGEMDISQRAAARELGVDERTMRYWCSGKHDPPAMAFMALEYLADVRKGLRSPLTSTQGTDMITNIELSAAATERFNSWFADSAKAGVRIEAVVSEMLDVFADRLASGESLSYELAARYTKSGTTAIFHVDRDDLIIAEQDDE